MITLFSKHFANPANYDYILNYVISLAEQCIQQHNTYELHVNLKSFTVNRSATLFEYHQTFL